MKNTKNEILEQIGDYIIEYRKMGGSITTYVPVAIHEDVKLELKDDVKNFIASKLQEVGRALPKEVIKDIDALVPVQANKRHNMALLRLKNKALAQLKGEQHE